MAKILGEAGSYTSDEAGKMHRRFALSGILGLAFIGFLMGFLVGRLMPTGRTVPLKAIIVELVLAATAVGAGMFVMGRLDRYDRERRKMQKGSNGEVKVGTILSRLSDSYRIVHGLGTPSGDLDHIVVGPSGVFVVDAKNWRGIVSSDGNGELLLNGKPTDKATIKPLIGRTMEVRDRVRTLCGFEPPFFKVLLAFTSARVEAPWGTTGAADCVTDEQLQERIEERRNGNGLGNDQIDAIARAFRALAVMEKK